MTARRAFPVFLLVLSALFVAPLAKGQVSLTTLGSPYTQNFDALATSGTANAWTDNSTIAGWYAQFSATPANPTTYRADSGGSNTGAIYSWGVAGVNALTERAFGMLSSGTPVTVLTGVRFVNNTGATITSLQVSYNGEQWRDGGAVTPVAQTTFFEYQVANAGTITDANTPTTGWTSFSSLDFTSPTFTNTGAGAAIEGNLPANRTAKSATITVTVNPGQEIWLRWRDPNDAGNDHGLGVDDLSVTPQGAANAPVVPTCPATLTTTFGTATSTGVSASDTDGTVTSATITGITPSNPGTITLTGFTPAGGVGGTANATLNVSNTTPAGSYNVTIQWANNDGTPQTANCVVAVTVNPPPVVVKIHDVQGNGAASPVVGNTVTVEGIVIGNYQGTSKLSGFFLQEEDADFDADPNTSEGIFVFCSACPTAVAEGQRVQATGVVSEFNNMTEITASTAPSVVVTNAGNNLALVTPSPIDLPVAGVVDDFYEHREGMKVTFVDTLTVSEYFELPRYGQTILYEGGRPRQFTEANPPSVAGNAAQADNLSRRKVIVDDENNAQEWYLTTSTPPGPADGLQYVFLPRANGGFSVGTQGTDFFRGGDLVNGLTGVLHWSFPGFGADTWRIRPTAANPTTFTVANPRPATPPAVGGAIKVVGMNLLNYFTTIDTTSSNSSGPCGPGGTLDCRGADSAAELNRQRERASIVICSLNADVYGFAELENTTPNASITDLLGAVNARCGGAHPYAFVNTGGTLGTDAIRVQQIYRTGIVSPVGAPLSDLDPVHNRPPTAQTYDVVDATNPAFGQRFTAIINHFKSKGCPGTGADADAGDGQGCFNGTRTAQATRLLSWINSTVLPAAGDPDVILLGDFNSYAKEDPVNTLIAGGYTDLETLFHGANAYSYLFDGQLGHLDYGFASASMLPQVTGADAWHINADESDLFDYNDEVKDTGESTFEEKPDGSALVPPRVVFQPSSPYRASDHDPVLLGLFAIADLAITKTDSPDPVTAGNNLTYTITVANNGPDAASTASWTDTLPAGTTFVSLPNVAGWSCTTPAVGAGGTVTCSNPTFAVGNAVFTLTVNVAPTVAAGTVLSNTATVTSATAEGNPGDESDTEMTTVAASANLTVTKTDSPDPVTAGANLTYTITVNNAGPSNASTVSLSDTLPTGTTFVSLSSPGGWSCSTPAVGATGTVTCSIASLAVTSAGFTLVVNVDSSVAAATVLSNTATATSTTSDPSTGDESDTETTTVGASADLSVTKTDSPDPVNAGNNLTYTITVNNAGPSSASTVSLSDTIPTGTTFVSLSSPGGWSCSTPAVGGTGTVTCSIASLGVTNAVFTLVVNVNANVASGTVLSNTANVTSTTSDPSTGNEGDTETTTVATSADVQVTKVDTPDPQDAGAVIVYTITVSNSGPSDAANVSFSDTIPANTTFSMLTGTAGWSCTTPAPLGTGTVTCTRATFPAGGSSVFTMTVEIDRSVAAGSVISNTANVSTTTPDSNSGNDSNTATTTVTTSADMQVIKTDTPDPVTAGSNITYSININNGGPSTATNVSFSDTLPANTTFVSLSGTGGWSCTTPAVGGTGTVNCSVSSLTFNVIFTLVVKVDPATPNGTVISNTANVSSSTTDPSPSNNSDTATTTVGVGSADLSLSKSDSPDPVTAGNNLTYTITLTNAGPSSATSATFSDTLPAGTTFVSLSTTGPWSCTTPAVGATGTVSCTNPSFGVTVDFFTLVVNVDPSLASGTVLSNTATIGAATTDPNTGNESDTETTNVVTFADMQVTKVDSPDPVTAGTNITYTITVTNAGPSNAASAALADTVPANTTFVSLTSPGGWSCATPAVGGTGAINCSIASLASGANAVFTLVVKADPSLANGTVITNSATVSSTTPDPNGANTATATTTVGVGSANLSITKTDTPDPVNAGSNITYTITINNAGPTNAGTVSLSDTLPANTTFVSLASPGGWSCITPAVGAAGTVTCTNPNVGLGNAVFTLVVKVAAATANGTIITNTATVSSTTADPNTGNESATATTTVTAVPTSDTDGDGVNDAIEQAAPNGGDGNGDGIPDYTQSNVASLPAATGSGYLTLQSSCSLQQVSVTTEGAMPASDPGFSYPHGLISFRAPCSSATFSLFIYGSGAANAYRKFGPLPPGGPQQWYGIPATFSTATVGSLHPRRADFSLTDGGTGDDTPVDGVIVDQGGPAEPVDVPTASEWGLLVLAMALAAFAALKLR